MRAYGKNWKVSDKDDLSVQSGLVLANLIKGETLKIGNNVYKVTVQSKKTLRLTRIDIKKSFSFKIDMLEEFGTWSCTSGKGFDSAHQLLRDIEGDLILDKINSNNPLHEKTDCGNILLRDPIFENYIEIKIWKLKSFYDILITKLTPYIKQEYTRYSNGIKGEYKETKEAFEIFNKYTRKEKLTDEEKTIFKDQMIDILKSVGVVLPTQLLPLPLVGTFLLIVMEHVFEKIGVKILPSSFY